MNARRLAATFGVAIALISSGSAVALQDATPGATPAGPPLPEGCAVVADGLTNPRYVAAADDGTIYVSEAGTGGDELVQPSVDPAATPAPATDAGPPGTRGTTGQVTMIAPDGTQSVVASGLPSYSMGLEIIGPAGLTIADDGTLLLANGGAGPAAAFTEALPNENSVLSIDPASGEVTLLADIGAYERASNPDGFAIDTNLYGIDVGEDGTIYVNDAGGNATYSVPAGGGEPTVLAVHPGLPLPEGMDAPPGGNPGRDGAPELDPVPTGVLSVNGSVIVGLLSGGPFPPGAAKVVSVAADGTLSDVATGLTMVVDVTAGPDGHLYATQISTNFLGEMPAPGNVVRLLEDGTQEIVVDGLMLPNGIDFDANGNLLVVVGTVSVTGEPTGMVLSCEGIAASAEGSSEEVTIALRDVFFRSW